MFVKKSRQKHIEPQNETKKSIHFQTREKNWSKLKRNENQTSIIIFPAFCSEHKRSKNEYWKPWSSVQNETWTQHV